jgi:hypothetical protein
MPARRPPWQSRAPAAPFLLLVLPHNTATTHPERQTGRRWTPLCGFAAGASNAVAAWGTIRTGAEIAPSTERTTQCVVGRQLRSPPLCGPANATVPAPAWRLPRFRSVGGLPGKARNDQPGRTGRNPSRLVHTVAGSTRTALTGGGPSSVAASTTANWRGGSWPRVCQMPKRDKGMPQSVVS